MKSLSTFVSKTLQKIDSEAQSVILSHKETLDRVSNDIKLLEEKLKQAALPFTYIYILSSEKKRYRGKAYKLVSPYEEVSHTADFIEYKDHCLVWGKSSNDDHRLSHNIYVTTDEMRGYANDAGIFEGIAKEGVPLLISSKPLIETKSHFRMKIEKDLSFFYENVIVALITKKGEGRIVEYGADLIERMKVAEDLFLPLESPPMIAERSFKE